MDTIIANKYSDILGILDVEISKKLEGEYDVEEIISTFKNFFFNKMFLDITAIKDYKYLDNLKKLSMNINMDKVILLLDKEDAISKSKEFLSKLVNMGIYNFTEDSNNLMYLYTNPNIYRDVAYYQESYSEEKKEVNGALLNSKKILGIKNITDHAGSTTLAYLIKKVLSDYYSTMAIEVGKRDLTYFKDKDCLSIDENKLEDTIKKYDAIDVVVVDLGKTKKDYLCTDILYLIEPSTIKLNKLVTINPNIFKEIKDKNVILNKSLLNEADIATFEVESDVKIFYNLPPLNDKEDVNNILLPLLSKINYVKEVEESKTVEKRSIFDLFKKNK